MTTQMIIIMILCILLGFVFGFTLGAVTIIDIAVKYSKKGENK